MLLSIIFGLITIGITVVIQGYGTLYWLKKFDQYHFDSNLHSFRRRSLRLIISTAIFLIVLHLIQSALWAVIYMAHPDILEFETFEKALYFSLVTFTTLGYGEITISSDNRILAGLEAINGIILIGWSTAFMFAVFAEVIKKSIETRSSGKQK